MRVRKKWGNFKPGVDLCEPAEKRPAQRTAQNLGIKRSPLAPPIFTLNNWRSSPRGRINEEGGSAWQNRERYTGLKH
eukprot:63979-Prorocentrum_minimum.AAC.2